jgi:flagellar biosynthetic protein FliR
MTLSAAAEDAVLAAMIAFCRIGGCLMTMPGFSSSRIPPQVRLLVALAVTLMLAPLARAAMPSALASQNLSALIPLMLGELGAGLTIGLMGRFYFLALQFLASAAAMAAGYTTVSDAADDGEAEPELATLFTLAATALFFALGLHHEVIAALLASYAVIEPGAAFAGDGALAQLAAALGKASALALQVVSPIIIFSVILNFLFGLFNKLVPQAPVAFISAPFIIAGCLFMALSTVQESVGLFMQGFAAWLASGSP